MCYLECTSLILLVLASSFFSCSEIAFFSLPKSTVRLWRHSPIQTKKMTATLLGRSKDLLVLIFFMNTLVNGLVQNLSSSLLNTVMAGLWIKIIIPFLLILLLGDYIPKYIGLIQSEKIVLFAAPFFDKLKAFLFRPLQKMTHFAESVSSAFFFFLKPEPTIRQKDLYEIMSTSEALGLLSPTESALITRSIELQSAYAKDKLVPINELTKIQKDSVSYRDVKLLLTQSKFHVICLVQGSSEEVIGIIDPQLVNETMKDTSQLIKKVKSKILFVPETMRIDRLLHQMALARATYAAVFDEHGRIEGILSEKLLQEDFTLPFSGKIEREEYEALHSFLFDATTPLDSINRLFGYSLVSEHDQKTIGGWLIEEMDMIPPIGTSFVFQGLLFRVVEAKPTHLERLFIQPIHKEGELR